MKMIHYKSYVAGWLDSSIHDVLDALPRSSKATSFGLITCLDSNLEPMIQGASPRARGNHRLSDWNPRRPGVHPRARGETTLFKEKAHAGAGASPRARGNLERPQR